MSFIAPQNADGTFVAAQTSAYRDIRAPSGAWGGCTPAGSKSLISRVKTPVFRYGSC